MSDKRFAYKTVTSNNIIEKAKQEGAIVFGDQQTASGNLHDQSKIESLNTKQLWNRASAMRIWKINNPNATLNEAVKNFDWLYNNHAKIFNVIFAGHSLDTLRLMLDNIEKMKRGQTDYVAATQAVYNSEKSKPVTPQINNTDNVNSDCQEIENLIRPKKKQKNDDI